MSHIVADEQQTKLIAESHGDVEVRDRQGNRLGFVVKGMSEEDLVLAKKRLNSEQIRFSTKESIDHQRGLIE